MKKGVLIVLLSTISILAQVNSLWMPAVFSDNMVLQQKSDCRVWGKTVPGQMVVVTGNWGVQTEVKADEKGAWIATVKTKKAGGPYELTVFAGSEKKIFKNILLGEVWLCSGQSNMEMPLAGWPPNDTIQGSAEAISGADFQNLRLFTVARNYSVAKQEDCTGKWSVCSPSTIAGFSATAFFYGRKLMKELNVPIGLINTSWGGTPAQAWTEGDFLKPYPEYFKVVSNFSGIIEEVNKLNKWHAEQKQIQVPDLPDSIRWKDMHFDDAACAAKKHNDVRWNTMELPRQWESAGLKDYDGVVWFRKTISVPGNMRNKDLILYCGLIDDFDITYVNGIVVGATEVQGKWQDQRVYKISKEINNDSILVIACRVMDNQGGGGIWGKSEGLKLLLADNSAVQINLSGSWNYFPVAEYKNNTFYYWGDDFNTYSGKPKVSISLGAYTPSLLFNGMISPLIPFVFKGAIWYQGESNTDNPSEYRSLFPAMVSSWRKTMQNGNFPFYFVQIAPFDYGKETQSQFLREAQLMAESKIAGSGMAVTMDIGNTANIHPANKKDVGERLAKIALAKTYKKNLQYSGPVLKNVVYKNKKAIITTAFADGLYIKPVHGKNNFLIAGADGVFHEAEVVIQGTNLFVSSVNVDVPVAVRYCWSNTDEATLFNGSNLPSSSFRTDNWEK